jgi:ribonucleotide reductase beta subunit family protein with ferritin-like domain
VQFTADSLLIALGAPAYYNAQQPFEFMNLISAEGKTNFFERRVSEYALSSSKEEFSMDADF